MHIISPILYPILIGELGDEVVKIIYFCRHCGTDLGEVETEEAVSFDRLGLSSLTIEERMEMVHYGQDGSMTIKSICENCQDTLSRHPDYHQWTTFIQ